MPVEAYATVSGSFRKHLPDISAGISALRDLGVHVLSPRVSHPVGWSGDFLYLEGDSGEPSEVELAHLDAIKRSDFLYVVNPGGYLGVSSAFEMGFARAHNVPTFCSTKPPDSMLHGLLEYDVPVSEIVGEVSAKKGENRIAPLPEGSTLGQIQDYVAEMVKSKGFAQESLRDVALLLAEEVGEVAKAIRARSGLKAQRGTKAGEKLGEELADCFIYVIDLANLAGLDFDSGLRAKLASNARREWT